MIFVLIKIFEEIQHFGFLFQLFSKYRLYIYTIPNSSELIRFKNGEIFDKG